MAVLSIGTTTAASFVDDQILLMSGATLPQGVTGLGTINYATGLHSFVVNLGSVLSIPDKHITALTPAFMATGDSVWSIQILGTVQGKNTSGDKPTGVGLALSNGAALRASTITVGTEGTVYGNGIGLASATMMMVTNSGLIGGGVTGIFASASLGGGQSNLTLSPAGLAQNVTITNAALGEIFGQDYGIWNDSKSTLVVSNAGKITGGENTQSHNAGAVVSDGRLTLTNAATGEISGDIFSHWLGSAVTNQGIIYGTIRAEIDKSFIQSIDSLPPKLDVNRNGIFTDIGDVLADSPTLVGITVTNAGTIIGDDTVVKGSLVRDVLTNAATGVLRGNVEMGNGGDSVTNAGNVYGQIDMGKGNDTFSNAATGRVSVDVIDPDDAPAALDMGQGNDNATIAGLVVGRVDLGAGSDTLTLSGQINGPIYADHLFASGDEILPGDNLDGDDRITITASGRVNGPVYLGAGNNVINNSGVLDGESLYILDGAGPDRDVFAMIVARGGNDTLVNAAAGTIHGGVDLGDGNNTITNGGRIFAGQNEEFAALTTGAGHDTLTNTGRIGSEDPIFGAKGFVSSNLFNDRDHLDLVTAVSMGAGNDLLVNTGAASSATSGIFGLIEMGAGDDTVRGGASSEFVSTKGDTGADQYLLGAGADAFFLQDHDDKVDVFDGGLGLDLVDFGADRSVTSGGAGHRIDLSAGRITYFVNSLQDTIGNASVAGDTLRGIEQVIGSAGRDVIIGGAGAETIDGGAGGDTIRGGMGRDVLYGNSGSDVFVFGANTDAAGRVTLDSGVSRAARDIIMDFTRSRDGVGDQIWLNFDSNTRAGAAGVQNEFTFLGMNVGFSGNGGGTNRAEVRAIHQAGVTVIEVDTNGDRVADFTLALNGIHTLALADFYGNNVI